jgi:CRP-like cAMP-binding protein
LRSIAFWSHDLNEKEFEQARRGIVEKAIPKGAYICHRGDRLDSWTGVADGLIKLGTVSRSGKAVTLAGLRAGGWFGEGSVLKDEPRQYDLVALRDTRMALMNRSTFFWLFENSVAFNRYLVKQFNERLGQFIALVSTTGCWMRRGVSRATSPGCSTLCSIPASACTSRFRRRSSPCCAECHVRSRTSVLKLLKARACCGSSMAESPCSSSPVWAATESRRQGA